MKVIKNLKIIFSLLTVLFLLSGCGSSTNETNESKEEMEVVTIPVKERFIGENENVHLIKDNVTGCEYIYAGSYRSSWTYVHGSCTEVIAEEYGLKNLEK